MAPISNDATSPLVKLDRTCPLCQKHSPQWQVAVDAFQIKSIDPLDQRPTYEWRRHAFAHYNPELYFIWECPGCGFCGDMNAFLNPIDQTALTMPYFTKKANAILHEDGPYWQSSLLLEVLGGNEALCTCLAAVRRFWLAILLLDQISLIGQRDALPAARYCLHLSWLLGDALQTPERDQIIEVLRDWKEKLKKLWPDAPTTDAEAQMLALKYYDTYYYNSDMVSGGDGGIHVLQLVARLNIKLGYLKAAQDILFKCIRKANDQMLSEQRLIAGMAMPDPRRQTLLKRAEEREAFIDESKKLLALVKKLLPPPLPPLRNKRPIDIKK